MKNRIKIALLAPNPWGQLYLSSHWTHGLGHQQHDRLIQDVAALHERPTAAPLAVKTSMAVGGQAPGGMASLPSTGSGDGQE